MIIYKDKISGDEMFSDTYPVQKEEDGQVYKVVGKLTTETTDVDDSTIGGNKSAEAGGEDEGAEASSVSGINVIVANRLVETGFGKKKEYQAYVKDYMASVVEKLTEEGASAEEIKAFKTGATAFVKKVLAEFSEFQFFMGESQNGTAGLAYVKWEEETPFIYFLKGALEEEKV